MSFFHQGPLLQRSLAAYIHRQVPSAFWYVTTLKEEQSCGFWYPYPYLYRRIRATYTRLTCVVIIEVREMPFFHHKVLFFKELQPRYIHLTVCDNLQGGTVHVA
ncbi:uncharacterized protein [Lolium perenne]|uniref:uncharacterized protein isoform X1 n=1 Tax=Lolium perenne TaxID=4522 RepID=UPI003A9A2AB6